MAIYHLSMNVISRRAGRSATASAAYRSAERIIDERTREIHDYTRKRGVVHTEIVLPVCAPVWAQQRAALWNAVEQHNRRADAVVAREITLALPHELTHTQRQRLVTGFARQLANRYQIGIDVAIHQPSGPDARNYHAHLLLTSNRLSAFGLGPKVRELDPIATARAGPGQNAAEQLRQVWEQQANRALELAGHAQRIDHRTLEAQGIDREPTRHLGPAATEYERRTHQPSRRRLETEASREVAETTRALDKTNRALERAELYVADLEEARREHAQALAEERAEWERRQQAEKRQARERQAQQGRADQKRIKQMTAQELAAEIQRLTPRPVDRVMQAHPDMRQAYNQVEQLRQQVKSVTESIRLARYEAQQWRNEHSLRARLHDAGIPQHYLAERDRLQREQTQHQKLYTHQLEEAESYARQVADRLRRTITAEQAPARTRIAELERLRQAKIAQEQAQKRHQVVQDRQATPQLASTRHAAQKPLQAAQERHQTAPPRQPLSPPTLERTAAQKPLQTASERQDRPLTALEQEKAQRLRDAFDTLDKRSAMLRYPELVQLYPLVADAARYAQERILPAYHAQFVEKIKERGIQELAQGKTLPSPGRQRAPQPQRNAEREQEQDYGLEP